MKILNDPATKEKLAKLGGDPMPMTPAEFYAFVRKEIEANAALVKAAKIQVTDPGTRRQRAHANSPTA